MAEISYTKTNWVNNVTKLNADNMNHIENGIETLAVALNTKASVDYVDKTHYGYSGDDLLIIPEGTTTIGENAYKNVTGADTTTIYAAAVVDKLVSINPYGLEFDDWGLPTVVEMNMIQRDSQYGRIPELPNVEYWTSVEDRHDAGQAFCSEYALGESITGGSLYPKQMKFAVRPVRYF